MIRLRDRVEVLVPGATNSTAPEYDDLGNEIPGTAPAPIMEPARVRGLAGTEIEVSAQTVIRRYAITLLPNTQATPDSRIRWRGELHRIDGDVVRIDDLQNRPHHCEALMSRIIG